MTTVNPFITRTTRISKALAAFGAIAMASAAPALAHVHVSADHATPGDDAVLTFEVPNESDKGALTTELSVTLPNLTEVSTQQSPGWTARLDRDVSAGTVRSITWTAAPGTGIAPDQFALFRVAVQLPNADSVSFPATQTYADGTVVHWADPTPPGGAEPEHPAPTLALSGSPEPTDHHGAAAPAPSVTAAPSSPAPAAADDTARWLAGAALVVAAAGMTLTLVKRRA